LRLFFSSTVAFIFLLVEKIPQVIFNTFILLFIVDSPPTIISKYPTLRTIKANIHPTKVFSGFHNLYARHPSCNQLIPGGITIFSSIVFVVVGSIIIVLDCVQGISIAKELPVPISASQKRPFVIPDLVNPYSKATFFVHRLLTSIQSFFSFPGST
jgi:hypothetical protein